MISNAQKGAYYKARSRRWLEADGWTVFEMEVVRWVGRPGGGDRFPIKRDQLASDLGAMRGNRLAFIQVKGGKAASGRGIFPDAQRAFAQFAFPPWTEQWILAWAPRSREPRCIFVKSETRSHEQNARQKTVDEIPITHQRLRQARARNAQPTESIPPGDGAGPRPDPR